MGIRGSLKIKVLSTLVLLALILSNGAVIGIDRAFAQVEPPDKSSQPDVEVVNPYFTVEKIQTEDGLILERGTINAPPKPLPEFEAERLASIQPLPNAGVLTSFPSYDWVFGCSAVSGAMIAAHYDNNGYPNMYVGPTNGGLMPQTDTSWPTWYDGYVTYPNNPLIASHNGVDNRITKGSIDDYWVKYDSTANDPYITGGWTQHTWSDAIGDYMKTSQSAYENTDGSTHFYNWNDTAPDPSAPLTCTQMEGYDIDHLDGTYGRKLFYEARGYSVGDCYNQNTDNNFAGGFSLADFQAEIDAGHPVLLNLAGHSIVGYGYSGSTIYIRDTWDNDPTHTYTMPWGGSYSGMELYSVSVVHLEATAPPSAPTGLSATDGAYTDKVHLSWNIATGATRYEIYRNSTNSHTGETLLTDSQTSASYDDYSVIKDVPYYYWVKACNSQGCSGYSNVDSGYAASEVTVNMIYLPLIMNQEYIPSPTIINGDFEQGHVGWTEYSSAGYDLIYGDVDWAHSGSWIAYLGGYHNAVDQLYQDVTITASEPWLHFYGWINSEDVCDYDYFFLVFGGDLVGYISLCANNNTGGWVHFYVDMSDYIGSTDTLLFAVETDSSLYSDFFLDTVYLSATGPSSSSSIMLIEGTSDVFEPKPLLEGNGFKQKDINR